MNLLMFEKDKHVGVITISNPPANALSTAVISELEKLLYTIKGDSSIRTLVIRGQGRFFSAGADIKEFNRFENGDELKEAARKAQKVMDQIEAYPKPIIAAMHGAALGGGLELAMACHLRIVSNKAKLGLPELQLGLIPGYGGTLRLPQLVGLSKATEMILTSEAITGEEAVKIGLCNAAYSDEQVVDKALDLARKIASKSPLALCAALEQFQYTKSSMFKDGLQNESRLFGQLFDSHDGKEGILAFIEKREATFKGK